MGAEEIRVREVVERTVEREAQHRQRAGERRHAAARRVKSSPRHIEPAQQGEPDDHARMQVPPLPRRRGRRGERHPAAPLSVSAPKKRNSRATITPTASRRGTPNRNVKNLLSAFRCMENITTTANLVGES